MILIYVPIVCTQITENNILSINESKRIRIPTSAYSVSLVWLTQACLGSQKTKRNTSEQVQRLCAGRLRRPLTKGAMGATLVHPATIILSQGVVCYL